MSYNYILLVKYWKKKYLTRLKTTKQYKTRNTKHVSMVQMIYFITEIPTIQTEQLEFCIQGTLVASSGCRSPVPLRHPTVKTPTEKATPTTSQRCCLRFFKSKTCYRPVGRKAKINTVLEKGESIQTSSIINIFNMQTTPRAWCRCFHVLCLMHPWGQAAWCSKLYG